MVDAAAGSESVLGPPGGVGVVLDGDRQADSMLQGRLQGLVVPCDGWRVNDVRALTVDEPGRRDADGFDVVHCAEMVGHVDDGLRERHRVVRCVDADFFDDPSTRVDDAAGDLRSSDVNANGECHGTFFCP